LNRFHEQGMLLNCSSTDDTELIPWKDFIGREGYEEVGVFEGGFGEKKGIWRPETGVNDGIYPSLVDGHY